MPLEPVYGSNLKVVFVGTEPGKVSLKTGHYYSNKRNSFYKDLKESGFTPKTHKPEEDRILPQHYCIGLDDVYNNPQNLTSRLEKHKPRAVCLSS